MEKQKLYYVLVLASVNGDYAVNSVYTKPLRATERALELVKQEWHHGYIADVVVKCLDEGQIIEDYINEKMC